MEQEVIKMKLKKKNERRKKMIERIDSCQMYESTERVQIFYFDLLAQLVECWSFMFILTLFWRE